MKRREFLLGAIAAGVARRAGAQARDEAKLRRIAIMSLCFNSILKNPAQPDNAAKTLDILDLPQMYVDRYSVHNVEMQHSHFASTDAAYLEEFRARLARTHSRVTNINLEFGPQNISAADPALRQEAIDRTRQWIDHAVTLGCPRVMVNQGMPTQENKAAAIDRQMQEFEAVQMIGEHVNGVDAPEAIPLRTQDVPEMLELVRQTDPGPFLDRTIELGDYVGIRRDSQLVAMAGERLHFDGWREISAVCTAPTHRGHGLASRLVGALIAGIQDRSERAFLHVLITNTSAIRLYEELGFRVRRPLTPGRVVNPRGTSRINPTMPAGAARQHRDSGASTTWP